MSWSNITKSSSSWGNGSLDASTFTNVAKNFTGFDYLLLEDGSLLLLEDGTNIILEQTVTSTSWTNATEH